VSRAPERVPFPDVQDKTDEHGNARGARYFLDSNGRAWRDDGAMVKPTQKGKTINVKIQGGDVCRSLVSAVAEAFATTPRPDPCDEFGTWVPIIKPGTPIDPETSLTSCAARHIRWVPNSEACKWSRQDIEPETLIPIISS